MNGKTLFDKIWDRHVVADLGDGYALAACRPPSAA